MLIAPQTSAISYSLSILVVGKEEQTRRPVNNYQEALGFFVDGIKPSIYDNSG
jgi:hypothetical protein